MAYTKEELIAIALEHKEYFKSSKIWRRYAKENKLPSAEPYKRKFGSWKNAVNEIVGGYRTKQQQYDQETLASIALKHKDYFTTMKVWDAYAKKAFFA